MGGLGVCMEMMWRGVREVVGCCGWVLARQGMTQQLADGMEPYRCKGVIGACVVDAAHTAGS